MAEMTTCPDCGHPVGWDQKNGECPRNMQNYRSEQCRDREIAGLRAKVAELTEAAGSSRAAEPRKRTQALPDEWRARGMRATDIHVHPGPAPESLAYYQCAADLDAALAAEPPPAQAEGRASWSRKKQPVPGHAGWSFSIGLGGPCWFVINDRYGYDNVTIDRQGEVSARHAPAALVRWLLDNHPALDSWEPTPATESKTRGWDDSKPGFSGPPDYHANRPAPETK